MKKMRCGCRITRLLHWAIFLFLLMPFYFFIASPAHAATLKNIPTTSTWVTNGPVNSIVRTSTTVYLGGNFTRVGPAMGGFVPISAATGKVAARFPRISGTVYACIPDGAGGWFIGGFFTQIGSLARKNLAHVLPDGNVDPAWKADVNGSVYTLLISDGLLYIGGSFSYLNDQSRPLVGVVSVSTGTPIPWTPGAFNNLGGTVYSLAVTPTTTYIGSGTKISAIDNKMTRLDWNVDVNGKTNAMAISGRTLYVAGEFRAIGGKLQSGFAALDITTGSVMALNPMCSGVKAMAISNGKAYIGGKFSSVGGQTRNNLASFDLATGAVTDWNPNANDAVDCLAVTSGSVYAGGLFTNAGGRARNYLAEMDLTSGTATAWDPNSAGEVNTLAVAGGTVCAGGGFRFLGGVTRDKLLALDAATGTPTNWNSAYPCNGVIWDMAVSGGTMYVAGSFTSIAGQPRNHLAAFDVATGAITDWNPDADGIVGKIILSGGHAYITGNITNVGGQKRHYLAALDLYTGAATAWDPNPDGSVNTMVMQNGIVYVGGWFSNIGGKRRYYLAALDAVTGDATNWNAKLDYGKPQFPGSWHNYHVGALGIADGWVYGAQNDVISPTFNAYAISTGLPKAKPSQYFFVDEILPAGRALYIGGSFGGPFLSAQVHHLLAALDPSTLQFQSWMPDLNAREDYYATTPRISVSSLAAWGDTVYAGGDFSRVGGEPQAYFAQFDSTSTLASPPRARVAPSQIRMTWRWNETADMKNGFRIYADPGDNPPTTLVTTTTGTSWVQRSLTPNTRYAFQVTAYSDTDESLRSVLCTTYTLSAAPTAGQNVKASAAEGKAFPLGTLFTFGNPAVFGVGTPGGGAFKVSAYRYAWDKTPGHTFSGVEAQWAQDDLIFTPTQAGSYYLHLQSLNAGGVANPQTLDLGPYSVAATNGLRHWQQYR